MSEMHPDTKIGTLITACEEALVGEDWSELGATKTLDDFTSVELCEEIGGMFEYRHQIVKNRRAVLSDKFPLFLQTIKLHNPEIRIKYFDETDGPFYIRPNGEIPINYLDIILDCTIGADGRPYNGPHFAGIVNTGMFNMELKNHGFYSFLSPLKIVKVSELHIPHQFN